MNETDAVRTDALGVSLAGKTLLEGITFRVPAGQTLSIVGPNGAGKSTLLKALSGFVAPSHGSVEVLGRALGAGIGRDGLRDLRSRIGQVFQALQLVPRLTALENVLIGRLAVNRTLKSWARVFPDEETQKGRDALSALNILHLAEVRADRLSGGERQKVAIARALAQEAPLLLADEPTASLDPAAAQEIAELLARLARERGLTLITVVHAPALLPVLGGRVLGLKAGRVAFELKSADLGQEQLAALYRQEPRA
jgi:phosphonate transport system ATP-binding protein